MSTEFGVNLKYIDRFSITESDVINAHFDIALIGASYENSERTRMLSTTTHKLYLVDDHSEAVALIASKDILASNDSRYVAENLDGTLEFFGTSRRFCWYVPLEFLVGKGEPSPRHTIHDAMCYYWDNRIKDDTPIRTLGSAYNIETWRDLKKAVFGSNRIMEPSVYSALINGIAIPSTRN